MLSIVIINFRNPPLLRLALKSLNGNINPSFAKEIIVVDVASTIETRHVISEFPGTKLASFRDNIGYTKGVNEGLKISGGDAVLILNPDIIPLENSVEKMYEHLMANDNIGMIGPQLLNFDGTYQNSFFRFPSPWTLFFRRTFFGKFGPGKKNIEYFTMKDIDHNSPRPVDWLMGSAIMVKKSAVDKVGSLDEDLFLYMSDIDWPKRFWENGYTVLYYPESKMYHYHRRDSKGRFGVLDMLFKKESRWHLLDAIQYFRKHGFSARRVA